MSRCLKRGELGGPSTGVVWLSEASDGTENHRPCMGICRMEMLKGKEPCLGPSKGTQLRMTLKKEEWSSYQPVGIFLFISVAFGYQDLVRKSTAQSHLCALLGSEIGP